MTKKFAIVLALVIAVLTGCFYEKKPVGWKTTIESLSPQELAILETFFRALLSQSQGGYVLYGNKPICIEAFPHREEGSVFLAKWIHVHSTELKRGALLWKQLKLGRYCKNYVLHVCDNPNNQWQDILLINKKELSTIIQTNLALFQYVLGPHVTPATLSAQILNPTQSFASVLHNDRALIGILLGYGTQNALHCSRAENIDEGEATSPTFGFQTLQEEADWLKSKFVLSTQFSDEKSPLLPWFGCYDPKETRPLIDQYQQAQKQIANVLKSPNFLQEVCSQLFEERIARLSPPVNANKLLLPERKVLVQMVAQSIWHCIAEKDPQYTRSFLNGLQESEHNAPSLSEDAFCKLRTQVTQTKETLGESYAADHSFLKLRDELAYQAGLRVWNHLKLGKDLYSYSEIIHQLSQCQHNAPALPLDPETDAVLTHLHWLLYRN